MVPFAAGGVVDVTARQLGQKLSESMGQPVVIENKAGAGGTIAAEFVAKSPPDGYTLLMAFDSHAVNPHVYKNLRYHTFDDFAPVSFVGSIPLLFVANQNMVAQDIPSLVRLAKGGQTKLTYGSVGAGSSGHLAAEQFSQLAGISMLHVPFKGGAPAMSALMGDQVQMVIFAATAAVPLVAAGKVKALAVSGSKRSPALPGVPTMAEAGFPQINSGAWMGLLAPAGTPAQVVQKLNQEVAKALADPELNRKLGELAIQLSGSTPEELGAFIRNEHDKWGKLIKDVKLNLEQ
jgi:tripartite-type tricarboxylate transporter receptor subunit TctC